MPETSLNYRVQTDVSLSRESPAFRHNRNVVKVASALQSDLLQVSRGYWSVQDVVNLSATWKSVFNRMSEIKEQPRRRKTIDDILKLDSLWVNQVFTYNGWNVSKLFFIQLLSLFAGKTQKEYTSSLYSSGLTTVSLLTSPFLLHISLSQPFNLTLRTRATACGKGPACPKNCTSSSQKSPCSGRVVMCAYKHML